MNRDTRVDAHGVQAAQAPGLGTEAPWTRAAPPALSPPLSSRCWASRPGHVLLCAQSAPTKATTERVLYARVAVGVRAGADVHHSVCARVRGAAWHACAHACASVQPCGHEHVHRNVCSLRHHGHEGGGDQGLTLQATHAPPAPSLSHQVEGKGLAGAAREGRSSPSTSPAPPRSPQGPSGCGWGVLACTSPRPPPGGGQLWVRPAPRALYCRRRPHHPAAPDPRKTRGPEPSPRGARREAAGHPHPCWAPAFLQTCSLTPSRPGAPKRDPTLSDSSPQPWPRRRPRRHRQLSRQAATFPAAAGSALPGPGGTAVTLRSTRQPGRAPRLGEGPPDPARGRPGRGTHLWQTPSSS